MENPCRPALYSMYILSKTYHLKPLYMHMTVSKCELICNKHQQIPIITRNMQMWVVEGQGDFINFQRTDATLSKGSDQWINQCVNLTCRMLYDAKLLQEGCISLAAFARSVEGST